MKLTALEILLSVCNGISLVLLCKYWRQCRVLACNGVEFVASLEQILARKRVDTATEEASTPSADALNAMYEAIKPDAETAARQPARYRDMAVSVDEDGLIGMTIQGKSFSLFPGSALCLADELSKALRKRFHKPSPGEISSGTLSHLELGDTIGPVA